MARQPRNDVDYFPHAVKHGKKMSYIEKKYGNDGYAVWFKILEELGSTQFHYLNLNDEIQLMFLSDRCLVDEDKLINIINDLIRLNEFDKELWEQNKILFNPKFVESVSDAYKKRNNECVDRKSLLILLEGLGVRKPTKSNPKPPKGVPKGVGNTQSKEDYTKVNKTKEDLFDLFWDKYPKKVGKKKAEEKFLKLKESEIDKIMETIDSFIRHKPFKDYNHPNPTTYLNQERWNDEIVKQEPKVLYHI